MAERIEAADAPPPPPPPPPPDDGPNGRKPDIAPELSDALGDERQGADGSDASEPVGGADQQRHPGTPDTAPAEVTDGPARPDARDQVPDRDTSQPEPETSGQLRSDVSDDLRSDTADPRPDTDSPSDGTPVRPDGHDAEQVRPSAADDAEPTSPQAADRAPTETAEPSRPETPEPPAAPEIVRDPVVDETSARDASQPSADRSGLPKPDVSDELRLATPDAGKPEPPAEPETSPSPPGPVETAPQDGVDGANARLGAETSGQPERVQQDAADGRVDQPRSIHDFPDIAKLYPDEYKAWAGVRDPVERPQDLEGWIAGNNPGYGGPGRLANCGDCARTTAKTWFGDTSTAAALTRPGGELPERMTEWAAGNRPEPVKDMNEVGDRLKELGPGSLAIVGFDRAQGPGHWFNAANKEGTILAVDGQSGKVGQWPPSKDVFRWDESQMTNKDAIFFNAEGKVVRK